jgi:hypothetical protein
MNLPSLFRPRWRLVLIFVVLVGVCTAVVRRYEATSKVSWDMQTGWPMAWLSLARYHGPGGPNAPLRSVTIRGFGLLVCDRDAVCVGLTANGVDLGAFVIDAGLAYIAAGIISYGLSILLRPSWRVGLLFVVLLGASAAVVRHYEPKDKIHWDVDTGWPMAYLTLTRSYGPCGPIGNCRGISIRGFGLSVCDRDAICADLIVKDFGLGAFVIDAGLAYIAASLISYGLSSLPRAKAESSRQRRIQ